MPNAKVFAIPLGTKKKNQCKLLGFKDVRKPTDDSYNIEWVEALHFLATQSF